MRNIKNSYEFALWSGSSPEDLSVVRQSIRNIQRWPVKLIFTKSTIEQAVRSENKHRYYLAGSDEERALALAKLLENPKIQDILCTRGGYGNLRVLPILDEMKIRPKGAKRIWGYSDSTIIQHYLHERFGWNWVHSPMLCSHTFLHPTRKEKKALDHLFAEDYHPEYKLKVINQGDMKKGQHRAKLIGGNLCSLVSLMGTPWEPKPKRGYFLFIEDIGELPYKLDRLLQQLAFSKFFLKCRGVITGHFTSCQGHREVLRDWAQEQDLFMASKFEAGHNTPNLPIPMGESILVQLKNKEHAHVKLPAIGL